MLYPIKFVEWHEIVEWSYMLSKRILESDFRPDVIIAVGRGGFIPARLLCDFLDVEALLAIPIRWSEKVKRKGEKYLADLIRGIVRASREQRSIEESISEVVRNLEITISYDYSIDLHGKKTLLIEEIVVTGFHMSTAKEIVEGKWKSSQAKTATLVWKSSTSRLKPDYHVIEISDFTWIQFPWSRLDDYKQLVRVMLLEESVQQNKAHWTITEIRELFEKWYGVNLHALYLEEALKALQDDGVIKISQKDELKIVQTL